MLLFLQIIVVNLAVSVDNIGVIALSTRCLPPAQAKLASRMGVGLSIILKLVFIGIIGFLFEIPWLHIRIIGGLLLIYVIHNMLKESRCDVTGGQAAKGGNDRFLFALISIIATDISMSLDNVIAILSIVSADGAPLDVKGFVLITASLLICVPVLLWCSGTVTKLINRFPMVIYACAGYLAYTAVHMICKDELIMLLLESINMTYTTPIAILAGVGVVAASAYINGKRSQIQIKEKKRLVAVYIVAAADALVTLGMMGYLSTNPVHEGVRLSVETFFHFAPSGANGLYTIGRSPHLIALCACLIVTILIRDDTLRQMSPRAYLQKLTKAIQTMTGFILVDVAVATAGLTLMFGFGTFEPAAYLAYFAMQIVLYSSYISIFCWLRLLIERKSMMIIVSMIAIHLEIEGMELLMFLDRWPLFMGYLPGRYVHNMPLPIQSVDPSLLAGVVLCAGICILVTTWLGCSRCPAGKRRKRAT